MALRSKTLPRQRKLAVWERDGYRCVWCGGQPPIPESGQNRLPEWHLTVDHVVPLSKGGVHAMTNLVTMCNTCNQAKADRLLPGARLTQRIELVVA